MSRPLLLMISKDGTERIKPHFYGRQVLALFYDALADSDLGYIQVVLVAFRNRYNCNRGKRRRWRGEGRKSLRVSTLLFLRNNKWNKNKSRGEGTCNELDRLCLVTAVRWALHGALWLYKSPTKVIPLRFESLRYIKHRRRTISLDATAA